MADKKKPTLAEMKAFVGYPHMKRPETQPGASVQDIKALIEQRLPEKIMQSHAQQQALIKQAFADPTNPLLPAINAFITP